MSTRAKTRVLTATQPLARYENARAALAQCVKIDEVKIIRDQAMAVQVYAKQAKDTELIEHATEIRLRAERRAGELLAAMEKAKPRGSNQHEDRSRNATDPPTLKEMGITKAQSSRWQQHASLDEAEFEAKVAVHKSLAAKSLVASGRQQLGGPGDDEYLTPPEWMEPVRDVLGTIDLDPASCVEAQVNVQAARYFTIEDDGLKQDWHGTVFLNSPFSDPLPWVRKLIEEYESGRVSAAISLMSSNTSTRRFQEAAAVASAIGFPNKNIAFMHKTRGRMKQGMPAGQAFMYYGPNVEKFARRFAEVGFVVVPFKPRTAAVLPIRKVLWEVTLRKKAA